MSHRRIILGALIGAAALAAVPSAASAAASCTYDQTTREVNVRYGVGDETLTARNGLTLSFAGDDGAFRACLATNGSGVSATALNTTKVTIKAVSGTGAAHQETIIDESFGGFPESNANLRFFVFTGTNDRLTVQETAATESVRVREQSGGSALGPAVDLNFDGRDDVIMTTLNSIVEVHAGGNGDLVDASGANSFGVALFGDGGDDTLVGGQKGDLLEGGAGNDNLRAKDGLIETIRGGIGIDQAQLDPGDKPDSVETKTF